MDRCIYEFNIIYHSRICANSLRQQVNEIVEVQVKLSARPSDGFVHNGKANGGGLAWFAPEISEWGTALG
jgi:hypothetical protein